MKGLQERIQLLISTKGMTNTEFAEKIGVNPSIISHISSGRNKPSLDIVDKITETFREVRLEWLLKGKGAMTESDVNHSQEVKSVENKSRDFDLFNGMIDAGGKLPKAGSTDKSDKLKQETNSTKIAHSDEGKTSQFVTENTEKELVNPKFEQKNTHVEHLEKKYPQKTSRKTIERIVIFYEDKTFSEYYPEN